LQPAHRHHASDGSGSPHAVILVVDDEKSIRTLVTQLLQADGYAALSARDAQEALEIVRDSPSDIALVITDFDLPGLNGVDLCTELNQRRPGIGLIVMSGEPREIPGGLPFIGKPFGRATLMANVRHVLSAGMARDSASA